MPGGCTCDRWDGAFYPCPELFATWRLVAQASGIHQLEGVERGTQGRGGLPFLLALFLFVSSALYLLQCPLSSLRLHTKNWRGLEGLGGSFKPPFRKDLVSLLRKRSHKENLFNLLSALGFGGECED